MTAGSQDESLDEFAVRQDEWAQACKVASLRLPAVLDPPDDGAAGTWAVLEGVATPGQWRLTVNIRGGEGGQQLVEPDPPLMAEVPIAADLPELATKVGPRSWFFPDHGGAAGLEEPMTRLFTDADRHLRVNGWRRAGDWEPTEGEFFARIVRRPPG